MTKLAVTFTLAAMIAASTALDAQQITFGARAGGTGGVMTGAGAPGGGARGGGGGAGRGGGGRGTGGGFQIQGRVNLPPLPMPPSAGLSISRPIGTQITGVQTNPPPGFGPPTLSPFAARRGTYSRLHRPPSFGIPIGYGYGIAYGPSYAGETTYDRYRRPTPEPEVTTGTLFLDVTPPTALVFIDTAFVGSVADLQTRGVTLARGRHWLDLEAPGYDKKTIEINITAGEVLRYRVDLTPARQVAAIVIPPRPPETMYAIPGCYGGNRPPVAANLPPGCDIARVRVIRPQPRIN